MSRIGNPTIAPIEFEGLRYTQIDNGEREGLDQRTGYLAVTDITTGQRLAAIKAYSVEVDPDMEVDVQDVFLTHMLLDAPGRRLMLENEHGDRFHVALDDRSVTPAP